MLRLLILFQNCSRIALAGCGKTPSFSEIRNLKFAEAKAGYS